MVTTALRGTLRTIAARFRLASTLTLAGATGLLVCVVGSPSANADTPSVALGTAADYAVLAASTVTNTGPTVVTGDLGLSPGTSVTGFPPGQVTGTVHVSDSAATQAQSDLVTAYNDAAGRATTATVPVELGGTTKTAGVYDSAAGTFGITGTVTLDGQGDPNAVFVFKAASTLITASASGVNLVNGARSCNVFWQVGSSATLGTSSTLRGNVLALASITVTTGVTVDGRTLARNAAVTLDTNTITRPTCVASPIGTTTTLASSVNPVPGNQPVTFTATVTANSGRAIPTGVVVFGDDRMFIIGLANVDSTGHAVFTTTALVVGIHRITADYLGPIGFLASTSPTMLEFVLNPGPGTGTGVRRGPGV
jgi:hypothetical protein